MAIPCQGFTFTWGGLPLAEVQEMEVDFARGLPTARTAQWSASPGEVRLLSFSAANLSSSEYGKRKRLQIIAATNTTGGTLTLLDSDAIYRDAVFTATANDAVRFAHVFSIQDTLNAPTT